MSGKVTVSPYNPVQQSGCRALTPPNLFAVANFAPTAKDNSANPGDLWIYLNTGAYVLLGKPMGVANWLNIGSSGSGVTSISGTTNQVAASSSTGAVTLSTPSTFIAPGSVAASSTVTAGTGLVSTLGNLQLLGAASRVLINAATPSTASVGFFTLTGSTPFVLSSSAITANSVILLTLKTLGTVTSASTITYIPTAGSASLTISAPTDTSTYGYLIIN